MIKRTGRRDIIRPSVDEQIRECMCPPTLSASPEPETFRQGDEALKYVYYFCRKLFEVRRSYSFFSEDLLTAPSDCLDDGAISIWSRGPHAVNERIPALPDFLQFREEF